MLLNHEYFAPRYTILFILVQAQETQNTGIGHTHFMVCGKIESWVLLYGFCCVRDIL